MMYGFINDILYLNTDNNYVFVECIHKQKRQCDSSFVLYINGIDKTLEYAFYEEYFRNDTLQWIFKIHNTHNNINDNNFNNNLYNIFDNILNNNIIYSSYFSINELFNNICIIDDNINDNDLYNNISDNNLYKQNIIQKCMVINSIAFLLIKKYNIDNISNLNNIILYIYINGNGIIANMNEILEYTLDYNIDGNNNINSNNLNKNSNSNLNNSNNLQEVIKEKILLFYNENIKIN